MLNMFTNIMKGKHFLDKSKKCFR